MTDTTANRGGRPAKATRTEHVLSADTRRSADDVPLASRGVPALKPRKRSRKTVAVRLPADAGPGRWQVLACADAGRRVKEAGERNNCRAATRTLVIGACPPGTAWDVGGRKQVCQAVRPAGTLAQALRQVQEAGLAHLRDELPRKRRGLLPRDLRGFAEGSAAALARAHGAPAPARAAVRARASAAGGWSESVRTDRRENSPTTSVDERTVEASKELEDGGRGTSTSTMSTSFDVQACPGAAGDVPGVAKRRSVATARRSLPNGDYAEVVTTFELEARFTGEVAADAHWFQWDADITYSATIAGSSRAGGAVQRIPTRVYRGTVRIDDLPRSGGEGRISGLAVRGPKGKAVPSSGVASAQLALMTLQPKAAVASALDRAEQSFYDDAACVTLTLDPATATAPALEPGESVAVRAAVASREGAQPLADPVRFDASRLLGCPDGTGGTVPPGPLTAPATATYTAPQDRTTPRCVGAESLGRRGRGAAHVVFRLPPPGPPAGYSGTILTTTTFDNGTVQRLEGTVVFTRFQNARRVFYGATGGTLRWTVSGTSPAGCTVSGEHTFTVYGPEPGSPAATLSPVEEQFGFGPGDRYELHGTKTSGLPQNTATKVCPDSGAEQLPNYGWTPIDWLETFPSRTDWHVGPDGTVAGSFEYTYTGAHVARSWSFRPLGG